MCRNMGTSYLRYDVGKQMLGVSCVLLSYLLSMTVFQWRVDSLRLSQESPEYLEQVIQEEEGRAELTDKLLLLDRLAPLENEVLEPKRKRSFPGSNTPLDRLSISTMDPKGSKQRKVVELPRRRVSVPMDRIGVGRLPSSRG